MNDVYILIGTVCGFYCLMHFIGSLIERRPSIFMGLLSAASCAALAYGWIQQGADFGVLQIPDAIIRAIGFLLN